MRYSLRRIDSSTKDKQSSSEQPEPPQLTSEDVVIAVMGVTGAGKSSFVNHFADTPVPVGHDLSSCTADLAIVSAKFDERRIYFVDTPGFDDSEGRSDTDILRELADWLGVAYEKRIKLTGIIYLHRISDNKVGGKGKRQIRVFKKLCGEEGLGNVVLATTRWSHTNEDYDREKELSANPDLWKDMIDQGSKVMRQDKGAISASVIVDHLLSKGKTVTLKIQREMIEQGKTLIDTAAGLEVAAEIERVKERHRRELVRIEAELKESQELKDLEWKKELDEAKREWQQKITAAEEQQRKLEVNWEQLQKIQDELQQLRDENQKLKEKNESRCIVM